MSTTTPTHALSPQQIDQFHGEGYAGPFAAVMPDEMAEIRQRIETDVLTCDGPSQNRLQARHLDHRFVYDLAAGPTIADRVASLVGDDLMLWTTYFVSKDPGGAEIPWHQDANYWPIEPAINISAWLAIDPVTTVNSCVNIIPGSHRAVIPHVKAREGMAFGQEADPQQVDASKAISMELKPGEFFLFTERLLHQSNPNTSDLRRMGMAMRYSLPWVKILDHEAPPLFPGHACVMARGEDRFGFNRFTQPPSA